ncbi:hypothetical protein [Roseibium algae]|uniref:Uncharacterized protein n=1 Tax=Roseibium algae TaxID=3123038 RepID=A0ABU8TPI7_9HYPH
MSNSTSPSWLHLLIGGIITAALIGTCYVLWAEAQSLSKGTFAREFRLLVSGLSIFCFLSIGNRLWGIVSQTLTKKPGTN